MSSPNRMETRASERKTERQSGFRSITSRLRMPRVVRGLLANRLSLTGLLVLLVFAVVAVSAPYLAPPKHPETPYQMPRDGFKAVPEPPSREHLFGTTQGQYDIFYGVVWGSRTAFKVGLLVTGATVLIGLVIGSVAGYYGGWIDEVLMRITEVFMAFPFLLAAITLTAVIKSRYPHLQGITIAMVALIVFGWTFYARLIRGDILSTKQTDYVMAARTMGAGDLRIMIRHILPNSFYPLLVVASLDIGSIVLAFAALSFLGLGAEEGYADWGQLISLARNWIPTLSSVWYILVFPGGAILLFVLAWNLVGDALRDILDPRLRNQGS